MHLYFKYKYLIIKGDTITGQSIDLEEVVILPRLRLNTNEERRRYLILQRKTLKVYPYAKLAAERLETLNARMAGVKSKRQRKKYTRMVQKFVENEFADKLKKFSHAVYRSGQISTRYGDFNYPYFSSDSLALSKTNSN